VSENIVGENIFLSALIRPSGQWAVNITFVDKQHFALQACPGMARQRAGMLRRSIPVRIS
jgi:hypothetical protein